MLEKPIDDLIEAGWHVLESDFDDAAFHHWKIQAFNCITALLGPDHTYAQHFEDYVKEAEKTRLLAGRGILAAVREQMRMKLIKNDNCVD